MPKDAELKITEIKTENVEEKINKNLANEIKLAVAYDIKILAEGKQKRISVLDVKNFIF